jgi:uncharacterized protein (TIGR02996 family)
MTDRQALLRAVAANPDEDTPRLMYADLLDELGGEANAARARFIRLQIDLARCPPSGWFAKSDRLCEVARLAGEFATHWLGELPKWAAAQTRGQRFGADDFPRGFLDSLTVSPGTFAAQGDQLLDVAPIQRLVAPGLLKRKAAQTFFHSPCLLRIRALALPDADADLIASLVSASPVLSGLEELDLSGSGLTDRSAAVLARAADLGNLRTLRSHRSRLTASGAAALLSAAWLPKLEALDIRDTPGSYWWYREVQANFPRKSILV